MPLFKRKSVEQKLFDAIGAASPIKVRNAIADGADVNAISRQDTTPLDVCLNNVMNYVGPDLKKIKNGFWDKDVTFIFNTSLIWNELVRAGGQLKKYENDPELKNGFSLTFRHFGNLGLYLRTISFAAPRARKKISANVPCSFDP